MIYFDNAATGGFKPSAVINAATTVTKYLCANPGRSAHRLAVTGEKIVYDCRCLLGQMFGATPERVILTKNCTEALNMAILGSVRAGGHVITTVFEHNSVLRPLYHLRDKGLISLDVVAPDKEQDIVQTISNKIKPETYLIAVTAISNVTGEVFPIRKVGEIAKEKGILFLVDGAQGGGHIPISVNKDYISMLALACHKGLYGIMGSGALILNGFVELCPITFGGTGVDSYSTTMPSNYPERLECGTVNLPAIAALCEGIRYARKNVSTFGEQLIFSSARLIDALKNIGNVTLYSNPNPAGIVSFGVNGLDSSFVADILNNEYDVAVRAGAHCAPLCHKHLNTQDFGLIRCSFAVQNTANEIDYFIKAIDKISKQ